MSSQSEKKPRPSHWTAPKGLLTIVLFLVLTALAEYAVIVYATSLGINDASILRWSFQFPGTNWMPTLEISLIFHVVPVCVVIALGFNWNYLTKKVALRRTEMRKGKVEHSPRQTEKRGLRSRISRASSNFSKRVRNGFSNMKRFSGISRRISSSKSVVASTIIVLLGFVMFTMLFSLFTYPQLIFHGIANAYQANPSMRDFVASVNAWFGGAAQALGPIGWLSTTINNGILAASPAIRNVGNGFGSLIGPLAALDGAGKFLVFQNAAVIMCALIALAYGQRAGKGYKYKK